MSRFFAGADIILLPFLPPNAAGRGARGLISIRQVLLCTIVMTTLPFLCPFST